MSDSFLGMFPWAPGGFVSSQDERAERLALVTPYADCLGWQYLTVEQHTDVGDEVHETNTFAYIPTEQQVGAAIAVANMQQTMMPDLAGSVPTNEAPALAQLIRSLYSQSADLWAEIAAADTEGWNI